MKLNLSQPFTLEIPHANAETEIIKGTLTPYSKTQRQESKKEFDNEKQSIKTLQKKSTKLRRLALQVEKAEQNNNTPEDAERLELLYAELDEKTDEVEALTDSLGDMDINEAIALKRFTTSVKTNKHERLIEICNLVGYVEVMETIHKDIEEGKLKSSQN